jgi:glycosyltransferase involved in cell wall biosynthesis
MRVLQIANYRVGVGGISAQVELFHKHLLAEGIGCKIFTTQGSFLQRVLSPLSLMFEGRDYDVFHIHACSNRGFYPAVVGIIIGKLLKKRILLTYHGGDAAVFFEKRIRFVKRFLLKTDTNIVLSGFLAEVFDQYDIPFTVLPNIMEYSPQSFKLRSIIQPHFISIRSLMPNYNIGCILKAFQIVKESLPEATLTILGDGKSREELEQYVFDNAIEDVLFTGRVSNSDIPAFLSQADVMVSSPKIDNMPVSVLEGFSSGLLVISSNVGGVPYMVSDGETGLLFDNDNYEMLAEKMLFACSHTELVQEMIINAYKSLGKYRWQSIRTKYIALCQG